MPTPKIDELSKEFIRKIPDTFRTSFTSGSNMPDGYILTAKEIVNYLNRAFRLLFTQKWSEAYKLANGSPGGTIKSFAGLLPELVKFTSTMVGDANLQGITVPIQAPYLDLFRVIAGVGKDNQFIKVWDESKFTIALSGEYEEYTATETNPAIIQANNTVFVFPQNLVNFEFKLQYIKLPVDPTTGGELKQNGNFDNPFSIHWDNTIIDLAYEIYLQEASETS